MPINYNDYHPKWSLISRLIRFKRAQNQCEWCGAKNGEPHPVTGSKVVLTVAHLDRDRTNNRFTNLAALCQRCHLNHDRQSHIYNRKYGRQTKYLTGKLFLVTPVFVLSQIVTTLKINHLSCGHTPTTCCDRGFKSAPLLKNDQKQGIFNTILIFLILYFYCHTVTNHQKTLATNWFSCHIICDSNIKKCVSCHNLSQFVTNLIINYIYVFLTPIIYLLLKINIVTNCDSKRQKTHYCHKLYGMRINNIHPHFG